MASDRATDLSALQKHMSEHGIPLITPSDPTFEATRACFVKREAAVPLAIARPQTAEHVQALVRHCTANGVRFVVRTGGHDCAGRSQVRSALTIDMRDIKYVHVSADEKTATVGGGILFRGLAKELDSRELITPMGTVAGVGYVGWATLGGYGPFSSKHGLGVDQILGAKLVNAKGDLVDASEELLQGIRGGGGTFGVIVELTIKVYPLKELLTSLIVYESSDLRAAWASYAEGYEKLRVGESLPSALALQPFGIELPGLGKVVAVTATWVDADQEEGKKWIAKIAVFGNCIMNNPEPKSVSAFIAFNESLVTYGSYGRVHTLNIAKYTAKTAEILAKHTESLPGGGMAVSLHSLRTPSPSDESVFGARVDHNMIELISLTPVKDLEAKGAEWAKELVRDLKANDPGNVLESSYVALVGEDDTDYRKIYGSHYSRMMDLKKKYDPENVFEYAVPRLLSA